MMLSRGGSNLLPFAHNYSIEEFRHARGSGNTSGTKKDVPYIQ